MFPATWPAAADVRHRLTVTPETPAALLGLVLVLSGVLAQDPIVLLLGLVASCASVLQRRVPLDVAVLSAAALVLLTAVVLGVVAGVLGLDLLARPWWLVAAYLTGSALSLAAAVRRPATFQRAGKALRRPGHRWSLLVLLPTAVAVGTALLQTRRPEVARSWAFWGTDLVRHMGGIAQVQRDGGIDFSTSGYPRGLHMLAALVSVPDAPLEDPAALLSYDLRLAAALTWLAVALVTGTGAVLILRVGRALGLPDSTCTVAAGLLGVVLLLSGSFVQTFVYMGALPSIVAMAVLWAVPVTVLSTPRLDRAAAVTVGSALSCLLLSHLWQALVVVPAVALAAYLLPLLRTLRTADRPRARPVAVSCVVVLVSALAAAPSFLALVRDGGAGLAAIEGGVPPDPYVFLATGLLGAGPLLLRMRDGWARLLVGSVLGLLVVVAVLLTGAGRGLDLDQYYPMKGLWFLTVFLAPLAALGVTVTASVLSRRTWALLGRTGPVARVLRTTAVAVTVALLGAFWAPTVLGAGSATTNTWRSVSPRGTSQDLRTGPWSTERYEIARAYGGAFPGAVTVPYFVGYHTVFDTLGTRVVSNVMEFLTGQPEVTGDGVDICTKITDVAGDRPAVVVSKLSSRVVRHDLRSNGCAGRARVVHVRGYLEVVEVPRAHP